MIRKIATIPIIIYQKTVSPDHGLFSFLYPNGYCQFHPTCSEYCRQSVMKYGVLSGYARGTWRVLRCHPWSKGGVDEA